MKQFLIMLVAIFSAAAVQAQQPLEPDQNPNYLQSQNKYMGTKDSVIAGFNTTFQDTYKAYDFYQARLERRAARRETRNQVRLIRAENSWYPNYNYNNFGNFGGFGYNPYNYYGSGLFPRVGFRTGNWWFNW